MSAELSSELLGEDWLAQEVGAFDIAVRGYNKQQVEDRLTQYGEALSQTAHERDVALDQAEQARAAAIRGSSAEITSTRLREILLLAEQEAEQIRADAVADLGSAVTEARAEAARLRAEAAAAAELERREAEHDARRIIEEARAEADRLLGGAEEAARDLATTTERNRRLATAEHEQLLAAQREEHEVILDGLRREVRDLAGRRDAVRAEISHLRDVLAGMIGLPATAAEPDQPEPVELPTPPPAAPSRAWRPAALANEVVDEFDPPTDEHQIVDLPEMGSTQSRREAASATASAVFDQEASPDPRPELRPGTERPPSRGPVRGTPHDRTDRRAPAVSGLKHTR